MKNMEELENEYVEETYVETEEEKLFRKLKYRFAHSKDYVDAHDSFTSLVLIPIFFLLPLVLLFSDPVNKAILFLSLFMLIYAVGRMVIYFHYWKIFEEENRELINICYSIEE